MGLVLPSLITETVRFEHYLPRFSTLSYMWASTPWRLHRSLVVEFPKLLPRDEYKEYEEERVINAISASCGWWAHSLCWLASEQGNERTAFSAILIGDVYYYCRACGFGTN